jgi:hypothetical protein
MKSVFKNGSYVKPSIMVLVLVLGGLLAAGILLHDREAVHAQSPDASQSSRIVGAWDVDALGAPFRPHVMTFHSDGTMLIDNPDAGDPSTSDSVGMGPWAYRNGAVIGKFEEITADRVTHQFVARLIVTFTLTVNGNRFTGPAEATFHNADGTTQGPFPATLTGTRLTLP